MTETDTPQPGEQERGDAAVLFDAQSITDLRGGMHHGAFDLAQLEHYLRAALHKIERLTRQRDQAREQTEAARVLYEGAHMLRHDALRELAEAQSDNRILRESLAMAYSGPSKLYADDGELTDSSTLPWIDYRRDSVEQIRDKIRERGLAFRAALAPAQEVRS